MERRLTEAHSPLRVSTRHLDAKSVHDQRARAHSEVTGRRGRQSSRVALPVEQEPLDSGRSDSSSPRSRMSRVGTMFRKEIIQGMEAASANPKKVPKGLESRLQTLGMGMHEMEGDSGT